jgi:hypothetical protein
MVTFTFFSPPGESPLSASLNIHAMHPFRPGGSTNQATPSADGRTFGLGAGHSAVSSITQ